MVVFSISKPSSDSLDGSLPKRLPMKSPTLLMTSAREVKLLSEDGDDVLEVTVSSSPGRVTVSSVCEDIVITETVEVSSLVTTDAVESGP